MPTPEQNKQTVAVFAREVFGNKNLGHASRGAALFPWDCLPSDDCSLS
jgi:hypothetical protein